MKLFLALVTTLSFANSAVVVPDEYEISKGSKIDYIYTKEHRALISHMRTYQESIVDSYEKEFGFQLDEKLSVGLASNNNQIANAFSTQIPFNMQLLYGAGVSYLDYFCYSSWLKTIIVHETAHNFQLNPKENSISKISHKILGNNPFALVGVVPLFPIPNLLESSFILEGNAVLNESRVGNGGRLFSGYALAEVVALAKARRITPELMYNSTLEFPYGEKAYLVGGFFQQFLLKSYGIKRVNSYFKKFATQPYPFFTNAIFKEHFGEDFETLLAEFATEMRLEHQTFKTTDGKLLTRSQIFTPLNVDGDEIYTLIGDKKSAPQIFSFNRKDRSIDFKEGTWRVGEAFKIGSSYYTQASAKTSPTKIEMGLFDQDGVLKEGTASQAVQGFTSLGKKVYFDIPNSIEIPQVYVDGKFYTQSHSSVYVKDKDLYYFKQEGKKRVLYKNKKMIISYEGYYGFVTDVQGDYIYFVASSKDGTTAYRTNGDNIERVSVFDDIIDFKLLDKKEALVVSIDANGYTYSLVELKVKEEEVLSNSVAQKGMSSLVKSEVTTSKPYHSFSALKYSFLNPMISYSNSSGIGLDLQVNFADPLLQNSLSFILSSNDERDIAGVKYDSEASQLLYGGAVYGVYKRDEIASRDKRDSGYEVYATLPLMEHGYWSAKTTLSYSKPYYDIYREPLSLSFDIEQKKRFGLSRYNNTLNALSLFVSSDRDSSIWGGDYSFEHDLFSQIYVGARATYMKSNRVNYFEEKGIELRDNFSSLQLDRATINVPSFSTTTYAKELKMGELSLSKVFDGSLYFYSFPLSLQREAFYLKQRRYDIDFSTTTQRNYDESIVGIDFDLLFLHKFVIPLSVKWIYNKDVRDTEQIRLLVGGTF